ncbi:hypothetical protein GOV07_00895 [Candidatus Woesearchaeota archaeon]|nr:hypothetical protein [Candidatus Woesearchaeota archaeon]
MNKEEPVEFADDAKVVVIHDELEEASANDPTFDGMRGNEIEEAYEDVMARLRNLHMDRFQHGAPADPLDLFDEIADELLIPGEQDIRLLVQKTKENEHFSFKEQEKILKAVKKFKSAKELQFSD